MDPVKVYGSFFIFIFGPLKCGYGKAEKKLYKGQTIF